MRRLERKQKGTLHWRYSRCLLEITAIVLLYIVGCVLSKNYNLLAFLWMFFGCVALFLYFAISNRNLLDMRGIFVASITGGIAFCQLRLSEIQVVWQTETWVYHALSLCCFILGFEVYSNNKKMVSCNSRIRSKFILKKFKFEFQPKKVYYATIFLAVMPIVLFCIQAKIKGFIPIFVQRYDAYTLFYTRLSIFINLVILSAPLAFWCLKNLELNKWQRMIMYLIIPLPTIIFQLMVQRGLFIWSACILLVMVYFQSKHKFAGVSLIILLLLFGVVFSSAMRGIPADAMKEIWRLNDQISVYNPGTIPEDDVTEEEDDVTEEMEPSEESAADKTQESDQNKSHGTQITVPSFLYAPYYYVINGMENFNNEVANLEQHSWGLKQLTPFTVVLRFPALKELIASYPSYAILPGSTSCLIEHFYYDFGAIGIILESLILGFLSALIQGFAVKKKDLFAYLEYGVFLAALITAFFAAWFSEFGTWLFMGTAFLIFLYTYFSRNKHNNCEVGKNEV